MSVEEYNSKIKLIEEKKEDIFDESNKANTFGKDLIGRKRNATSTTVKIIKDDSTIGGDRVGALTVFGEYDVDYFRLGKDIKLISQFVNQRISPNITLSKEEIDDGDLVYDSGLDQYNFGQGRDFKIIDKNRKLIPYTDIEGKPDTKSFLSKNQEEISGFPYVYNRSKKIDQYLNPEVASTNGAIDVFHVRSSPLSLGINDVQIRGAKGLFGSSNWILTQHTTYGKKGSSFIDDVYSIKDSPHDFYEDSQDVLLTKHIDGYVSEGTYKNTPFVDNDIFKNNYSHLSLSQRTTLLVSSSRNENEIGVRFKSRENGFMITPFYQTNEQRSFGKDSIAFSGLLKR
jgi:hypothetical protein